MTQASAKFESWHFSSTGPLTIDSQHMVAPHRRSPVSSRPPSLPALSLLCYDLGPAPQHPDVAAVSVYYLCVVVCFALSTAFHTLSDHSAPLHRFGNQLDHLGIVLVMWGTGVSGTHFALRCAPASLRILYFSAVTATAAGCAVFTLQPRFRTPSFRTARFLMYCFLGASLFAPVVHAWRGFGGGEDGLAAVSAVMGLRSFLGLALVNFAGAAVYAARVPERWFPGTFDLLGQSHNWMHVLVFTGALIRLGGLLEVCDGWAAEGGLAVYCQGAS